MSPIAFCENPKDSKCLSNVHLVYKKQTEVKTKSLKEEMDRLVARALPRLLILSARVGNPLRESMR